MGQSPASVRNVDDRMLSSQGRRCGVDQVRRPSRCIFRGARPAELIHATDFKIAEPPPSGHLALDRPVVGEGRRIH
jgi:hypothetical protein